MVVHPKLHNKPLIQRKENGGLNFVDLEINTKAVQLNWITRAYNNKLIKLHGPVP